MSKWGKRLLGLAAVSYTHLDVYKRQQLLCAGSSPGQRTLYDFSRKKLEQRNTRHQKTGVCGSISCLSEDDDIRSPESGPGS